MSKTITLDDAHFNIAAAKAKDLGISTDAYIESLIEAANAMFEHMLVPRDELSLPSPAVYGVFDDTIPEENKPPKPDFFK